jgi:hypothetical protein
MGKEIEEIKKEGLGREEKGGDEIRMEGKGRRLKKEGRERKKMNKGSRESEGKG